MGIKYKIAEPSDSKEIATLIIDLTNEISRVTGKNQFNISLETVTKQCEELITLGSYVVIIAENVNGPIGIATMSETYALYAGGKIGIIQEFYIKPSVREGGIGANLFDEVIALAHNRHWAAIELCTPPLPHFNRTMCFYENNGLVAVGGRKMRLALI